MGGLSKKAYQFDTISKEAARPFLAVDAGGLLFKRTKVLAASAEQETLTAAAIVKSYNLMDYQAVAIGREDLVAGFDFFKEMAELATFPWLSANLVAKGTTSPLFQASTQVKRGGLTLGIIGLTSPKLHIPLTEEDKAEVIDWRQPLALEIEKLSPVSDILVLLSNLEQQENRRISEQYPGIHILFQSGPGSSNRPPMLINNTLVGQTGPQGKYVGILEVEWHKGGIWGQDLSRQLQAQKRSLDQLNWQLGKFDKYPDPEQDLKEQPNRLRTYQDLVLRKKRQQEKLRVLEESMARESAASQTPSKYRNRFKAMETSLPDNEEIFEIIAALNETINELNQQQSQAPAASSPYLGSEKCGSCHQAQFEVWQQSAHSRAFQTLVAKNKHGDLNCLPCHLTGGTSSNWLQTAKEPKLHGVGCENCHGAGKEHGASPLTKRMQALPTAEVCLACHTPEHDDSFNFEADRKKLKCPTM